MLKVYLNFHERIMFIDSRRNYPLLEIFLVSFSPTKNFSPVLPMKILILQYIYVKRSFVVFILKSKI